MLTLFSMEYTQMLIMVFNLHPDRMIGFSKSKIYRSIVLVPVRSERERPLFGRTKYSEVLVMKPIQNVYLFLGVKVGRHFLRPPCLRGVWRWPAQKRELIRYPHVHGL